MAKRTDTLDEIIAAEVAAGNVSHLSFSPLITGAFQASYRTIDGIGYRIAIDEDPVKAIRDALLGTGTAAKTRVLITSTDGKREWGTVGVSENIIEASLEALVDSLEFALLKK